MMLRKLELINFGPHAKTIIRFGEGVNTLIGITDAGKSWVLRAMEWLAFNSYKGNDFIKYGQTHVEVRATFSDGVKRISRVKSKKENNYYIGKQPFKAGTGSPPQIVIDALNLGRINFFTQEDGVFFLSMTPPERGRYVNKLANIDIIDTAASNIAATLREENRELTTKKESLEKIAEELEEYKGLEKIEGMLQVAFAAENALLQKKRKYLGLKQTIKEIEKTQQQIIDLPDTTSAKRLIKKAEKVWEGLAIIKNRATFLERDIEKIEETQQRQKTIKKKLKDAETTLKEMMPEVCPLCATELS